MGGSQESGILRSADWYDLIQTATLDAVVTMGTDGRVIQWNHQAELMFGWSESEALGRKVSSLVMPERFRRAHHEGVQRFLESGVGPILGHRIELAGLRRDGTEFPVELNVTEGHIEGRRVFVAFLRDLTPLKESERLLMLRYDITRILSECENLDDAAERLMGAIFEATEWEVGAIFLLDEQRSSLCCEVCQQTPSAGASSFIAATESAQFERGVGLAGRVWEAGEPIFVPDLRKDANFPRLAAAEQVELRTASAFPILVGGHFQGVFELLSRREVKRDEGLERLLRSAGHQMGAFLERLKAVDALRESESRFRSIADAAPVMIWMTNANGEREYSSQPWLTFTGCTADDERGRGWLDAIHPDDREHYFELQRESHETRRPFHAEYRLRRQDGIYRTILDHGALRLAADGTFLGFVGSSIDVTEWKDAEAKLLLAQKLEAVGLLAGGLAHDFSNLLMAINGYAEATLASPNLPSDLREFVEEIAKAGKRASSMTQKLLEYGRRQVRRPEAFDLNGVVADMARSLAPSLGTDVDLVLSLSTDPMPVYADADQVRQVLMNLVLNARDAMPEGGKLVIETESVDLEANALEGTSGPHVILSVTDTGSGMSEETRARIFEPFFTTKEVGKGAGLGLSSAYGIVQQSSGRIEVESKEEHGTTVRVFLPRSAPEEAATAEERSDDDLSGGSESPLVLVVDDEEVVRRLLVRALETNGFAVLSAGDGTEALPMIESNPRIQALVTDVVMPHMSGTALAKASLKMRPSLPVLFISGHPEHVSADVDELETGTELMVKPFKASDLVRKVRSMVESDARPTEPRDDARA